VPGDEKYHVCSTASCFPVVGPPRALPCALSFFFLTSRSRLSFYFCFDWLVSISLFFHKSAVSALLLLKPTWASRGLR